MALVQLSQSAGLAWNKQPPQVGASHHRTGAERCCLVSLAPKVTSPKSLLVTQAVFCKKLQVSVLLEPRDGLRWMELTRNHFFHFSFSAAVTKCLQKAAFLKYEGEQLCMCCDRIIYHSVQTKPFLMFLTGDGLESHLLYRSRENCSKTV